MTLHQISDEDILEFVKKETGSVCKCGSKVFIVTDRYDAIVNAESGSVENGHGIQMVKCDACGYIYFQGIAMALTSI